MLFKTRIKPVPSILRTALAVNSALLLTLVLLVRQGSAQTQPAIVQAHLTLVTPIVHAGSTIRASVTADIASGYHINDHHPSLDYLIPTDLKFTPIDGFTVASILYPKGKVEKLAFSDTELSVYEGKIEINAQLKVAPGTPPGEYTLRGKLEYQACNDHACFPPTGVPLVAKVKVVSRNS
ncbi:MAG TPA: protein-disulfide reductase DsbD domain-containing protein [Terriglobia bacterium]|nr:protein-disulfide reductase DsbD domain-containing protein [Terriglobia bacterium]